MGAPRASLRSSPPPDECKNARKEALRVCVTGRTIARARGASGARARALMMTLSPVRSTQLETCPRAAVT